MSYLWHLSVELYNDVHCVYLTGHCRNRWESIHELYDRCHFVALLSQCHHEGYDDVILKKKFPRHWPFVRGITGQRWIPLTKAGDAGFDVFFDLRLNKRLSKQSWDWWFETPSRPLWRHCNDMFKVNWCQTATKHNKAGRMHHLWDVLHVCNRVDDFEIQLYIGISW